MFKMMKCTLLKKDAHYAMLPATTDYMVKYFWLS